MTDFYVPESSELNDYKSDPMVIVNKKYLKHLAGVNYRGGDYEPQPADEWHPRCNSYYPYTEDVDAINRVHHLVASKKFMTSIFDFGSDNRPNTDLYSEDEAQLNHLYSNPATFIILGKPGIGEQKLAKMLADHWRCIYIDPEVLVEEEIRSGSRAGQCMEFNLRCGRAIAVDVILRLVEKRVHSKSAKHRGFVICGFPLIRNDMYQEDPVSSESAVFTVQDIFEELLEPIGVTPQVVKNVSQTSQLAEQSRVTLDDEENEEKSVAEEEQIVEQEEKKAPPHEFSIDIGSAASAICKSTNIGTDYAEQINFLFSLCHQPLVIIYIMCHNIDVVTKHENYRYDLLNQEVVNLQRDQTENIIYTIYTKQPGFENEDLPEDIPGGFGEHSLGLTSSEMMYLTYLPRDFSGNIATQLEHYRFDALPTIEKYVLLHDPQYFIKVDGRISPSRMFNIVKTRLRILPLPGVVIPQKLVTTLEPIGGEGGGDEIDPYGFDNKSPEECFEELRKRQTVSRMFKYDWSRWKTKCPVSMKEGIYVDGSPKYSMRFMNKIFFLTDEAAVTKFTRNPRPYLLPPCPRSTCKVFIIGPKCSGKSAVANCIALLLNGKVLHPHALHTDFVKRKEKTFLDKIRSAAINEGVILLTQARAHEYEMAENERLDKLKKWTEEQMDLIDKRLDLHAAVTVTTSMSRMTSFPLRRTSAQFDDELFNKHRDEFNILKIKFEQNGLPFFGDVKLCSSLSHSPGELLNYLPDELKAPTELPQPVNVFDDFVTEYADAAAENASCGDLEMSPEDIIEMYMTAIKETEEKNAQEGEFHGGWILDGVPVDVDIIDRLITGCKPDDILILRDPGCTFLVNRFRIKDQNEFRNYKDFFNKLGKPTIANRSPSLTSTVSYKSRMAREVVQDILMDEQFTGETLRKDDENEFVNVDYFATHSTRLAIKEYEEELTNFDEDIHNVLDFLNESGIPFIDIDVADKSLEEVMKEAIKEIDTRYQLEAHAITPEERLQEIEDFGDPELGGEGMDEEGEIPAESENNFMINRRLGDTGIYCPVTYHNHGVLWKGKEEYAAKYENKLYLLCNENALNDFINNPKQCLSGNPPQIPPPRICVVGVAGSGKTSLSKALSKILGLYYVSCEDLVRNSEGTFSSLIGESESVNDEDDLLDKINLKRIWFDEPIKSCGFVLDDFPKRPTDIEYIETFSTIPDIIIELFSTDIEANKRQVQRQIDEWQRNLDETRKQREKFNNDLMMEWVERREARIKDLREAKRQERYQIKIELKSSANLETVQEESGQSSDRSQISYDSVAEEAELEEVIKIADMELPEPVFDDEWETLEEATERIINETGDNFVSDTEFYHLLKDYCEKELIEWVTVDGNLSEEKVIDQAMRAVDKIKFRNESFLERCYGVTVDVADQLLDCGYYLTSRFGKVCPVQLYEKDNPVLMFLPLEQKFEVYPILHRSYVYFLAGKGNRDKFVGDPLKYVAQEKAQFPLIPFKVAIIGPPKSGKTELAERFKRDLGFRYISIGQAARYVLRFLPYSKLAKTMESVLRNGWELTSEMTIKCVEAMAFDGKGITQGLVFDGFPNSKSDVDHLAEVGLVPNLVIDLQATIENIREYLDTDKGKRGLPAFSQHFIAHRCQEWSKDSDKFREWFDQEYQVLAKVHVNVSKWGVWSATYDLVTAVAFEVKHYYKHCHKDMALRLANMQVVFYLNILGHIRTMFYNPATRRVPVPDERFDYLCEYFKPASKVPAFLNIVDIAGLVKGASENEGLGNAFLSHISACDAIFHLCRAFEDDNVIHVEGDVNPVRDIEIIGEELRLKDEEMLNKYLEKVERTVVRGNDKKMKPEYDVLVKVKGVLVDQKQHIRFADWHTNDIEILNKYLFLTSKPMIYLVNLSEKDYIKKKNKWLLKIKEWVDKNDPGAIIIPFSGALEHKLVEIEDPVLRKKYLDDHGTTSALEKIIVQGYKALQLEYFFTSGADEVKAWTIQKGTKAPQAAGKIHTDFEKGFIMAEVMKYSDFKDEGSETAVKAAGKYRQQGRNYVVEDGDIIFFKFNAGAGLKDPKKK